jgi:acetyl-CoA acetyltransferase
MLNDPIVIVGAARTPMGGFSSGRSLCSLNFAVAKLAFTEATNWLEVQYVE